LQWKTQNSGKSPEKVLASYRFPVIKVIGKQGIPYRSLIIREPNEKKIKDIGFTLLSVRYGMCLQLQPGDMFLLFLKY